MYYEKKDKYMELFSCQYTLLHYLFKVIRQIYILKKCDFQTSKIYTLNIECKMSENF